MEHGYIVIIRSTTPYRFPKAADRIHSVRCRLKETAERIVVEVNRSKHIYATWYKD